MKKLMCLLAVALCGSLCNTAMAAGEAPEIKVTTISFENGANFDGQIPAAMKPVTDAIAKVYPQATFGLEKDILRVGLKIKDIPAGKIVSLKATGFDCPVNSSFEFQESAELAIADVIRPTLVAWTQVRHKHRGLESAKVDRYTEHYPGRIEVVLLAQN